MDFRNATKLFEDPDFGGVGKFKEALKELEQQLYEVG